MLGFHWLEQVFTVASSGYFCMLFDIQQERGSPSSQPFPANYQSLLSTGLQGPAQVSPKDCVLTFTFCGSNWWWNIVAAPTQTPGSHGDLTLLPSYGTVDLHRPGTHLASALQRVRQAVAHLLTLNRNETVSVNWGKEVALGHPPVFWARTESEQPSYFIRGIQRDKAAAGFGKQPVIWLTKDCKGTYM